MNELEQYRLEIDDIDKKMVELFEKRMNVSMKVAEYKNNNNLPIYNQIRESEVIKKNVSQLKNKEYEILLRRFYLQVMELSRSVQEEIIKLK